MTQSQRATELSLQAAAKLFCDMTKQEKLGSGCVALGEALKEASKAHTKWGLDGTLRDAASYADKVCEIEQSYLTARKGLAVISAVKCFVALKGPTGMEKRDSLLKQKELLPRPLWQLLEKVR